MQVEPSLLRVSERDTCLMCHAEVAADRGPDWHTHGALDQGCVGCHDPHASEHRYQLHATAPDLCLKCHEQVVRQGAVHLSVDLLLEKGVLVSKALDVILHGHPFAILQLESLTTLLI